MTDFLIVGQGIVGTIMSHYLLKAGFSVHIVDHSRDWSASKVAAGLFNPITYRRFVKSWKADLFYPEAEKYYRENGDLIDEKILFHVPFVKIFNDIREQNDWMASTGDKRIIDYVSEDLYTGDFDGKVKMPFGGGVVDKAGYVKIKQFLKLNRELFFEKGLLSESKELVNVQGNDGASVSVKVGEKDIVAKRVIFCEGAKSVENPYFNWLPFQPVKGEVLTIKSPELNIDVALNKGFFVLPIGNDLYHVGSTFNWRNPDEVITEEAKEEILGKFREITSVDFEVINHVAGVRPAIRDRHPVIGCHPEKENMLIFNGTGSKGVMMVPWVAKHYVEYLKGEVELDKELDIKRFNKFYQSERES